MTERMTAAALQAFRKSEGDTKAPPKDREGPIHRAILEYLSLALPKDAVVHHSPNELDMAGKEAARQIAKARDLGTKPGWPDLEIIWNGRVHFLEVKPKNRSMSDDQKEVTQNLSAAGARCAVVHSVDEAREILESWGVI